MSDIEVLEPPPSRNLTTVAKMKLTLGIPASDESKDDLLADMITSASDFIRRYTGRDFARQVVTEKLPGKGTPDLILSITPLVEVLSVKKDGMNYTDWTILDREAGFIQREAGFTSTAFGHSSIDRAPSSFYRYAWEVTYEGGYILPGWGSSQGELNLPFDLQRAVSEIVKSAYMGRGMDGNWKSYKIGDTAVSFGSTTGGGAAGADASNAIAGIPPNALSVLQWYRRAF